MSSYALKTTDQVGGGFLYQCHKARNELLLACQEPEQTQQRLLAKIVGENASTVFGREHGFASIRNLTDYRRQVPIRNYDQQATWIERVIAGERNALTADTPYMFLKTSGTTGRSKAIPQTRQWRLDYRSPAIHAQWATYAKYHPYILSHRHAVMDLSWERDNPKERLGALPYQSITHRSHALPGGDWMPPWYDEPWFSFIGNDIGYTDRIYSRLRYLAGQDLRCIVAVNPSTIVALANHLMARTSQLIKDIRDGILFGRSIAPPNADLAAALEARAKNGGLRPSDVWPNLNLIVCWRSASAALYSKQLMAEFPDAELLPFMTTGTEGVVTIPVDRHPTAGVLALNQGLYEFVPCSDPSEDTMREDAQTLSFNALELGHTYRLIMTQANGLYRYDAGDLYRVVGLVGRAPRLEFVGRAGCVSSFTGEKLTESQVIHATQAALDAVGLEAKTFTCCPVWDKPPRYALIAEPRGVWPREKRQRLQAEMDLQLGAANEEYVGKRASGRLGPAFLTVVPPGTFQRLWDARVAQGASGSQLKHHWLQCDGRLLEDLRRLVPVESV